MANARSYTADLPGGTATTTIQMQSKRLLKNALFSMVTAAAGEVELSTSPAPQIGVAQPTSDVLARLRIPATAGNLVAEIPISLTVAPFENVYIHQTGAGNVGCVTLS